ncbi:hypothetical protein OOK41_09090 [Micromonospora sp. NBC_01655]|uniref:hypothetical protein n=1 Tax=Micromonospora sp. NBC_01655 TaxID=2975983 RepID=UPI00225C31C5|nr:hypothetical protein [Micromonospora sp. NBC_01655]MCX4470460.1 hypothetical protein [Micromonospora sp. NBC_01655]
MYSDLGVTKTTRRAGGPTWAGEFPVDCAPITLDADAVLAVYADGIIPSGACLALVTATGRHAPYGGSTEEVQSVAITGTPTGGTYTLTYSGQTTAAIPYNATAAQVRTALEALSTIGAGNVTTAGGPHPGSAVTVTFVGALANTNVAQMTANSTALTGGTTPTVTVSTTTGGGTDTGSGGTEVAKGFLLNDRQVRAGRHVDAALYYRGRVYEDLLPSNGGFDAQARAELAPTIYFDKVGA